MHEVNTRHFQKWKAENYQPYGTVQALNLTKQTSNMKYMSKLSFTGFYNSMLMLIEV